MDGIEKKYGIDEDNIGSLQSELIGLRNDRAKNNTVISSYQKSLSEALKNGNMGIEINEALNEGKMWKVKKTKIMKHRINAFFEKFFKIL